VAARFIQAGYQENTLAKTPLGKLPREAIRLLELPRPPQDIIDGFMTLVDLTGKWRMETVEVNGVVQICGIQVRPGDLVCADEAGVAFVPRARAAEVLEIARQIDAGDNKRKADIDKGASVADLITRKYK